MDTAPVWRTPAVRAALASGDLGAVVRIVRQARHLTLAQLGARCGYSGSTISRLETGKQPLRDVAVRRSLATALGIPVHLFGLTDTSARTVPIPAPTARVDPILRPDEETDPMRRRTLLAGLGGLTGSAFLRAPTPAAADPMAALVSSLLAPPTSRPPADTARLHLEVQTVRTRFHQGQYTQVRDTLPRLVRAARATQATSTRHAADLAELYTLSTELLLKTGDDHLAGTTADRALEFAYASGDILAAASARRAWAMVLRRTGHPGIANRLVTDTATELQPTLGRGTDHLSVYGSLLATAAYTAATSGDRDTAHTLITEAATAARHLGPTHDIHTTAFDPVVVDLYQISIARALGDPGTAIGIAARITPAAIPTTERRGQYWTDIARAYDQWDKPAHCYQALLAAEQTTPDEVRHRGHIQDITHRLLDHPHATTLPELQAFARRVGITT